MADRGTVTFVFTDVEGSTRLLKELRDRYGDLLAEHQRIVREAFGARGGEEVDTQGDAFFYVFPRARDAAMAAADAQRGLAAYPWPEGSVFRIRIGIHTGEPNISDAGKYHGLGVHRAARIMAAGHGGQILVSQATASVLSDDEPPGIGIRDLGAHKLKDLDRPERIFQLDVEGLPQAFAPIRTAEKQAGFWTGRRRVAGGALAVVVAVAVALVLLLGGSALSRVDSNALGVIDAASGKITAQILVGAAPTHVAVGEGAIWITNADDHSVSRVSPDSNSVVDTIELDSSPGGITTGNGFVWVTSLQGNVARIDPRAGKVVDKIDVGNGPGGILFAAGAIWVANTGDETITRIDPNSGKPTKTLDVGAAEFTFGAGTLWVSQRTSNRVVRIDPASESVVERISVGNGPSALVFGDGDAWVANALDGTVSRIDADTNAVAATIATGSGPTALAFGAGNVWVSNEFDETVTAVDAKTARVVRRIKVGNRPQGLAISGNELVVTVRQSGAAHRGGTLTIRSSAPVDSIDTAVAYSTQSWPFIRMTNDGLVAFNQASGLAGTQLVPDLAVSLPTPTDEGKTYSFRLRPNVRYSTGAALKASDFRATFERALKIGKIPAGYYSDIVGAAACMKAPARCDLSRGIVTDDANRIVVFHLVQPNAEFLYQLALTFAYVLPAGTPAQETKEPLPATGPYVIADYEFGKILKLTRNRHFREWSKAAQPSGYPNEIVFSTDGSADDAMTDVVEGKADVSSTYLSGVPSKDTLARINTQFASQVRENPVQRTYAMFLNTRIPPFNNADARMAMNFAADRAAAVEAAGGSAAAQATCQILPPYFPGYRPYCPYTAGDSADGTWKAPDLAKARSLVAKSGTRGARVTVYAFAQAPEFAPYMANLLRSLGYRPAVKTIDGPPYFEAIGDSRTKVQAGFTPWSSDYPAASGFFKPILSCAAFIPNTPSNLNASQFCDPAIDRQIEQALRVQGLDPDASRGLWQRVDKQTVDQAPWVPLVNGRSFDVLSKRVGNYQYSPAWGPLFHLFWVR